MVNGEWSIESHRFNDELILEPTQKESVLPANLSIQKIMVQTIAFAFSLPGLPVFRK